MVAEDGEEGVAEVVFQVPKNGWGISEALGETEDDDAGSSASDGDPEPVTPDSIDGHVAGDRERAEDSGDQ